MSITKNPFEKPFHGSAGKNKPEPKADVTATPGKIARTTPDPAAAAPKKPVTHDGGLPPTRKGPEKGEDVITGRSAAGFQKVNPFHTPKHPQVSNTGPRPEDPVLWEPPKKPVVAATAHGQEVVVPNAAPDDFAKRVAESGKDLTAAEMTGDNYQKIYLAQQQAEAERLAEEQRLAADKFAAQQKQMEQTAADTEKARGLLAKMASLQLKLVPNMDPAEAYKIHGEIEEMRVALAQLKFNG